MGEGVNALLPTGNTRGFHGRDVSAVTFFRKIPRPMKGRSLEEPGSVGIGAGGVVPVAGIDPKEPSCAPGGYADLPAAARAGRPGCSPDHPL